jgi:AbrB family looped-hinge helix DNA binding protein
MVQARLTVKGQVTIPKKIRDYLQLDDGSKRTIIYQAIKLTQTGKANFANYLIGATNRNYDCSQTVTFDQKLKGEKWYQVLT